MPTAWAPSCSAWLTRTIRLTRPPTQWLCFSKNHQSPDGRWYSTAYRPPLESSDIQTTATTLHAVQVYAPQAQRADYDRAVQHAAAWLSRAQPRTTEDRAYQLLGLAWAGTDQKIIKQAAAGLLAEQRPDGGWAQLPSLSSDAFATGQALVALAQSGALAVADAAYQRGAQYLMGTLPDLLCFSYNALPETAMMSST